VQIVCDEPEQGGIYMLVVSRKVGQSIHIGNDIIIYFIEKTGTLSMRVGIEAPKDVRILRSELIETNKSNKDSESKDIELIDGKSWNF